MINILFFQILVLDKMSRFSPKIEIINHFDNLINKVDIDIDSNLEKYNDEKVIGELITNSENNRKTFRNFDDFYGEFDDEFDVEMFYSYKHQHQALDLWSKSTKVIDYLKQVRFETIEELRKAQEDTLTSYKLNNSRFSILSNQNNINELRSELFAEKFYFQVNFTQSEKRLWAFDVFTFVTDFYLSPSHIDSLE